MFKALINFVKGWYRTEGPIFLHEPRFGEIDRRYVLDAIDSTFVSSVGEYVSRFEKDLAEYLGAKHAVAVVNGTAALQIAVRLSGAKPCEEVITQPLTFIATANAIIYNGATPVFVDVSRDTLGLCPIALEEFLEKNATKKEGKTLNKTTGKRIAAIVPMHTFGHPCEMDAIVELGDHWGIPVIEDAAEALGSKFKNRSCGILGKAGIISFNGNKIITCGGGGAIITNDTNLANKAKHLTTTAKISHPWEFIHDEIGYNFRMPNLNAALACAQLEQIDTFLASKRELAKAYMEFFKGIDWGRFVEEPKGTISNYWLNSVIVHDKHLRDALLKATNEASIMTRPAWKTIPDLEMYKYCQKGDLKNAKWLQKRIVNLPSSVMHHV